MSVYKAGQYNVPNYQVSGLPFVTYAVAPAIVEFPYLTQWIAVRTDTILRAAFSENALNTSHINGGSTSFVEIVPLNTRIKKLYIVGGSCYLIAGLTSIESGFELINTASLAAISGSTDLDSTNIFAYSGI